MKTGLKVLIVIIFLLLLTFLYLVAEGLYARAKSDCEQSNECPNNSYCAISKNIGALCGGDFGFCHNINRCFPHLCPKGQVAITCNRFAEYLKTYYGNPEQRLKWKESAENYCLSLDMPIGEERRSTIVNMAKELSAQKNEECSIIEDNIYPN